MKYYIKHSLDNRIMDPEQLNDYLIPIMPVEERRNTENKPRCHLTLAATENGRLGQSKCTGYEALEKLRLARIDEYDDLLASRVSPVMRIDFGEYDAPEIDERAVLLYYEKVLRVHRRKSITESAEESMRACREIWAITPAAERRPYVQLALYRQRGSREGLSRLYGLDEEVEYKRFVELRDAATAPATADDGDGDDISMRANLDEAAMEIRNAEEFNEVAPEAGAVDREFSVEDMDVDLVTNNSDEELESAGIIRGEDYDAMGDIGDEIDEFLH